MASGPARAADKVVDVVEASNVTLRVIEYSKPLKANETGDDKITANTDFKINREVVAMSCEFFGILLKTNDFSEAGQTLIELKERKAGPMKAILCALHYNDKESAESLFGKAVIKDTMSLPPACLWGIISYARSFMMDQKLFKDWFALWYDQNNLHVADSILLYPCFQFDYARAFLRTTRDVVYHGAGYFKEENPSGFRDLHLRQLITQQLNAARGRLKTLLTRKLHDPIQELLHAQCKCTQQTLFNYLLALEGTNGWPVEEACKRYGIADIIKKLQTFPRYLVNKPDSDCDTCDYLALERRVQRACTSVSEEFDGLCLDCMDHTQHKFSKESDDYWKHWMSDVECQWDGNCRVDHDESTWYFSFMGRREDREDVIAKIRRSKKRYVNHVYSF